MSKITQALEKAARERLQRTQEQVTVPTSTPIAVPLVTSRLGQIAQAGEVRIDPHIVSAADSQSPIAEQYRILRTNLQSLRLKQGPKVIVVTSAVNGEGKSVTSINLALTFARQENLKVLLIDADMRKSTVHKWLGLGGAPETGLSSLLEHGGDPSGSLMTLKEPPLTVLPAGKHPDHPAELLESMNMKKLLATLKTQFDLIIIDAPPVLPVSDPGILAAQADGVLLVVRAGRTQRKTALEAKELLKKMRANLLGCVLTHVEYYLPGYSRYYQYYREHAKDGNGTSSSASSAERS